MDFLEDFIDKLELTFKVLFSVALFGAGIVDIILIFSWFIGGFIWYGILGIIALILITTFFLMTTGIGD